MQITDRGLEQLADLSRLERLDLSYSNVSDRGIAALVGMKALQVLDLSFTRISDACSGDLCSLHNLKQLTHRPNEISPDAINNLKTYLPNCQFIG